jgi:hypothetical protein
MADPDPLSALVVRAQPRGLVGLTDLSARRHVRAAPGPNVLSFTAPWPPFQEMERNAGDCFLQRETWRELRCQPIPRPSVIWRAGRRHPGRPCGRGRALRVPGPA